MTWTSRIPQVQAAFLNAVSSGVSAGGQAYANPVRRRLMNGYTSGAFSRGGGGVAGEVIVTDPEPTPDGDGVQVRVGTDVMYALFWEIGHVNIFVRSGPAASTLLQKGEYHLPGGGVTGTYQRVEIWRPFLLENAGQIRAKIHSVMRARLLAMGAPA